MAARGVKAMRAELATRLRPWRDAFTKLDEYLGTQLPLAGDKQRFQTGTLADALATVLETPHPDDTPFPALDAYCLFTASPWADRLGYNKARRWHFAEMKARGRTELFDATAAKSGKQFATELLSRLSSLCAWIEAERSFGSWCLARQNHEQWTRDGSLTTARTRAAHALAKLWRFPNDVSDWGFSHLLRGGEWNGKRTPGVIPACKVQSGTQWAAILEHAATIARAKPWQPSAADQWVWMRYPIFRRYKWNAREVFKALPQSLHESGETEPRFRRKWIERGLRFTGGKTSRRKPPLLDFVTTAKVPRTFGTGVVVFCVP